MHWSCQATLETVALFGLISLTTQTKGWEYCGQALSWIGTAKKGWNMRRNLPVTQREYPLPAGFSLVSTTDTRGRITYCNPAFVEVSGYSRDELIGQPHNLIRHPDMPEEAFRDMWATIRAGLPWSAPVKNRRKDGDHYWVVANVTPLRDGDQVTGYVSVRTHASRDLIERTEAAYTRLSEDAQRRLPQWRVHRGEVQSLRPLARLTRVLQPGPMMQLCLLLLGAALSATVATEAVGMAGGGLATLLTAVLGTTLVLAGLAWAGRRQLIAPVEDLLAQANRLAAGDLRFADPRRQQGLFARCERALRQVAVNLASMVQDTRVGARELRGTAGDLAQGNQDLSSRTESQASSLEQTAASMEQITGTVRQNSHTASGAARFAAEVAGITGRSAEAVRQANATMHGIQSASQRIGEIIQVIDGIAFQTSLLALNAAVEAARAGEQGRGFAVVAAEVRSLAQRTSAAAREVKQLIEESGLTVEAGSLHAGQACTIMDEALGSVHRLNELLSQIDSGSSEQLSGISQVNEAVAHMDALTQQNTALVEELSAASTAVAQQAQQLEQGLQLFRLANDEAGVARHLPSA